MKRRIALLLTLALAFTAATFTRSGSVTKAQNQNKAVFDTGMVVLGPNQKLRVAFSAGGDSGSLAVREIMYMSPTCAPAGACRYQVASESDLGPFNLMAGEAASFDMTGSGSGVRIVARTNIKNATATVQIIDVVTGNIESFSLGITNI
jgi:hypothetical protein